MRGATLTRIFFMKASKLISKCQRCSQYGMYIKLKLNNQFTFEQFLTRTIII